MGKLKLTNIKKIYCADNDITTLKDLEDSITLEELDCSNNRLINLEGLEKLINLKILN